MSHEVRSKSVSVTERLVVQIALAEKRHQTQKILTSQIWQKKISMKAINL